MGMRNVENTLYGLISFLTRAPLFFARRFTNKLAEPMKAYRLNGDWKLWSSMALTGKVAYLGELLNYFRFHDQSVRGGDKLLDVAAVESLRLVRWLLQKLHVPYAERVEIGKSHSLLWTTVILRKGMSNKRRRVILQSAMVADPAALPRLIWAVLQKFIGDHIRVFYGTLHLMRPARYVMPLVYAGNRSQFSGFIEKFYWPCRRTQEAAIKRTVIATSN